MCAIASNENAQYPSEPEQTCVFALYPRCIVAFVVSSNGIGDGDGSKIVVFVVVFSTIV